ncbi:MucR family transcriptional regulator [Methylocystis parvus]|uniref:MucR family transcriptional regulator n=1 Tax=Methylocystis parvus TaxID=134 RepID=A0A6B8MC25_9HYPH|nr:MucR family transcriptional regulator [Methylocystis parvus]QGM99945.1 MucR family transcriptional regulator [Methylocystis parvus]WBK02366.1 MucR family transcriptional regulator [Methylocystis parvus OBBP]
MTAIEDADGVNATELAAEIVAAFVAHNSLPITELPGLIHAVDSALRGLGSGAPAAAAIEKREPAVPIKKSITPDYLICLDDGKQFKSLKRHLAALGMTPDAYRAKWGLPESYPMVAPNYAAQRSQLALKMGLGQARKQETAKRSRKTNGRAGV